MKNLMKTYYFPLLLISSLFLGGAFGFLFGPYVEYIKPLGEIFLNLILTAIVPMIFFNVSSAIARNGSLKQFGNMMSSMAIIFLVTAIIASLYAMAVVKLFPPAEGASIQFAAANAMAPIHFSKQIVSIFTVSDFSHLLSHHHILPLIAFSMLVGLACISTRKHGELFVKFLQSGEDIFMKVFSLIMYFAPIGFFAYFAVFVHEVGPKLLETYARIAIGYAIFSMLYFIVVYTIYAYLASGIDGVKLFWKNIFLPMVTAFATCSSAASIPANLLATKAMGISAEISDTVVPLGTIIHKEGSIIGGIVKIAFLFGLFHMDFSGTSVLLTALGVSLLVGTVMGAIPGGGMLGELLILSVYGFPATALVSIVAISLIIDPFATMLNVTGNTISSLLIGRWVGGIKIR